MNSRTTPTHVQAVPGCPRGVSIYRIPASPYWQFRYFTNERYVRRSTRETSLAKAKARAKELYTDTLLKDRLNISVHSNTFEAAAREFLDWQRLQVDLKNLDRRTQDEDFKKLRLDILPFFGSLDLTQITTQKLDEYLGTLSTRNLSKSTLNKHVGVIRKLLRHASNNGKLKTLPRFPRIGADNNARPYFDLVSYDKLKEAALNFAKDDYCGVYEVLRSFCSQAEI